MEKTKGITVSVSVTDTDVFKDMIRVSYAEIERRCSYGEDKRNYGLGFCYRHGCI